MNSQSENTPIEEAKEYVFSQVIRPALESDLSNEVKNKIKSVKTLISQFDRIGDLFVYLSRFDKENKDETYQCMKGKNLQTFEDILNNFKSKFALWCNDHTRLTDFIEGKKYRPYQILIFANAYDPRSGGIFVIKEEDKPVYVIIKATLKGGQYPNEWIEVGSSLKYYLKSIKGDFGDHFKANEAILKNNKIPVVTFVRETNNDDFTYFGIFENERKVDELDGTKYFILKHKALSSDSLILSDHLKNNFERSVEISMKLDPQNRLTRLANAPKKPTIINTITTAFIRNPDVVAEVLLRADGKCEKCFSPAPFYRRSDKSPYLEVHHKIQLASGGDDTVENAIALCPNCHRKVHYG